MLCSIFSVAAISIVSKISRIYEMWSGNAAMSGVTVGETIYINKGASIAHNAENIGVMRRL